MLRWGTLGETQSNLSHVCCHQRSVITSVIPIHTPSTPYPQYSPNWRPNPVAQLLLCTSPQDPLNQQPHTFVSPPLTTLFRYTPLRSTRARLPRTNSCRVPARARPSAGAPVGGRVVPDELTRFAQDGTSRHRTSHKEGSGRRQTWGCVGFPDVSCGFKKSLQSAGPPCFKEEISFRFSPVSLSFHFSGLVVPRRPPLRESRPCENIQKPENKCA